MLNQVAKAEVIETDARLLLRVLKVTKALESHVGVDKSLYDNSPECDEWIDGVPSEKEPFRIARWSRADFSKEIYRLMVGWTTEDLNSIIQTIEQTIVSDSKKEEERYLTLLKCPSFKESETFDSWKKDLLDALSYFQSKHAKYSEVKEVLQSVLSTEIPATEDDSLDMTKTVFSLFSRRVVSRLGMSAFSDLQRFFDTQANDLLHGSSDNISGSPDRASLLKQFFAGTGDNVSAAQLKNIADKILSACKLDSEAVSILQDWIQETQNNIGEIPLQKHVDVILAVLRPLTDDEFASMSTLIINQTSPQAQQDAKENRKLAEQKALDLIESLQLQKDIYISDACQTAVEAISSVLEMGHAKHLIQGAISLIESSSFLNEASEMTSSEFLRFVAASRVLQPELMGVALGADSLENQVLESKKLVHFQKSGSNEGTPLNPLLRIVDGIPSAILRMVAVPVCNPSKKVVGVLSFKLQGETDDFDEPDILFLQVSLLLVH